MSWRRWLIRVVEVLPHSPATFLFVSPCLRALSQSAQGLCRDGHSCFCGSLCFLCDLALHICLTHRFCDPEGQEPCPVPLRVAPDVCQEHGRFSVTADWIEVKEPQGNRSFHSHMCCYILKFNTAQGNMLIKFINLYEKNLFLNWHVTKVWLYL